MANVIATDCTCSTKLMEKITAFGQEEYGLPPVQYKGAHVWGRYGDL